jgi:hypothetical protein
MGGARSILRPGLTPTAVPAELVLRLQKYRDPGDAPSSIREAAERVAREASRLIAPRVVVWRGPITRVEARGEVTMAGAHRFHSRKLGRFLARSSEALVVVLTVGPGIEDRVDEMMEAGQLRDAVLMDTAARAAVESLLSSVRGSLAATERSRGCQLGARFAPGHDDWPLAEQAELFQLFGETPLPVSLNSSAYMWPRKSLSAVFGVIPRDAR